MGLDRRRRLELGFKLGKKTSEKHVYIKTILLRRTTDHQWTDRRGEIRAEEEAYTSVIVQHPASRCVSTGYRRELFRAILINDIFITYSLF